MEMNGMAEDHLEVLQVYKLLRSVREKNKPQIKKMVCMGVPNLINLTVPKEGHGALSLASVANDEDMVQYLISLGAHPDIQDVRGRTPLMLAAKLGYHRILALLAKNHANMNLRDKEGKSVMFYCISPSEAHASCLQVALNFNANVNMCYSGKPLLVFACEKAKDCEDLCMSILDKGADPNVVDEVTGHTALMEVVMAGAMKLVRAILQRGGNPNAVNKEGLCAAHCAAERGFLEVLMVLSAYSADLGVSNRKGNTPLHFAAAGGFSDCCRFLSQRGCNPKLTNLDGQLPSQIAKNSGHNAALKELKKAERRHATLSAPNAVNPNEPWAVTLHDWSCEHEETLRRVFEMADGLNKPVENVPLEAFVSLLQVHNAPVSAENLQKIVAEHNKNQKGIIDLKTFFKGRAYLQKTFVITSYPPKQSQNLKNKEKGEKKKEVKSALDFPICTMPPIGGCPACMIEKYQPFIDTRRFSHRRPPIHPIEDDSAWYIDDPETKYINIHSCVRSGDLESLMLAFIKNMPVDVKDQFSMTPLMTACSNGNCKLAKFLIELGANVNAVDQFNQTPLHYACHEGHADIIRMLLESGAMVDAVSITKETPLMKAIKSCRFSCVEYLIKAGANVMAINEQEQNSLDIARNYGCGIIIDVVRAMYDSLPKIENDEVLKSASSKQKKQQDIQDIQFAETDEAPSVSAKQDLKQNIKLKKSKPVSSEQMKLDIPAPSVSTAAKQEMKENIILKNPMITMRRATEIDISFVPKTWWGKRLTSTSEERSFPRR